MSSSLNIKESIKSCQKESKVVNESLNEDNFTKLKRLSNTYNKSKLNCYYEEAYRVSQTKSKQVNKKTKIKRNNLPKRNQGLKQNQKIRPKHDHIGKNKINPSIVILLQKKYHKKDYNTRNKNHISNSTLTQLQNVPICSEKKNINDYKTIKNSPYSQTLPRTKEGLLFLQLQKNILKSHI